MIVDLHVHTTALSPCSSLDPEEAITEAKNNGVEAICFTEHGKLWRPEEIRCLGDKHSFPVFCGMEVETREGHMLVFGLKEEPPGLLPLLELRRIVDEAGGVIISAHPFRGFLLFGFADLKITIQNASKRPVFTMVDAMETYSGKSTKKENEMALEVGRVTGVKGVGGSDAHSAREIGRCVTIFNEPLKNEEELIARLKKGEFSAGYYRK